MTLEWVVVIEASPPPGVREATISNIRALMQRLAGMHPTTLYSADRYAVQLCVPAPSAPEALFLAVAAWRWAEASLRLPAWSLIRAELITPEEFERERRTSASPWLARQGDQKQEPALEPDERLLRQVFHDALTGLPNKQLFLDHMERALQRTQRTRAAHALLLCDIDDFDAFNRRLGEEAADAVLITVADQLAAMIRPGDALGRLGGDQFGVLLEDTSPEAAEVVASRLLATLARPASSGPIERVISTSIGIAISEPGQDATDLMRRARYALSKAKENAAGGYAFFDSNYKPRDLARVERSIPERPDRMAYSLLLQAAGIATEQTTLEDAARLVLRQVCAHTGWPVGHLYVVADDDSEALRPSNAWYMARPERFVQFVEETRQAVVAPKEEFLGSVLASSQPAWADLSSATTFVRKDAARAAGLAAGFFFPVLVGDEVIGVLEFYAEDYVEPDVSLRDVMYAVGAQLGWVVERARAEALRRSEEQLRALVENSSDLVSVVNADGTLRQHFGPRVLGYQVGDKVGRPLIDLVHPDDRKRAAAAMAEFLAHAGPSHRPLEVRLRHADMSWRWMEVVGNNLLDDPDVAGLVLTSRDVTTRKRAEAAPREQRDEETSGSVVS